MVHRVLLNTAAILLEVGCFKRICTSNTYFRSLLAFLLFVCQLCPPY